MQYKVIITKEQDEINVWLDKGWIIESVTAQHVSSPHYAEKGSFCFVIYHLQNKLN